MEQDIHYLPYESTGYFSKIVSDYLSPSALLKPFYQHEPTYEGIKASIAARKAFNTPRKLLVEVLQQQYNGITLSERLTKNIGLLEAENTFTVTTAHQPNIFTGPLYFIYKILHTIKLAAELNIRMPENHFVPVYYMGSEDADLDELGYVNVGGQKLVWETRQTGAVGRMKVDKALVKLLHAIHGQAGVLPFGKELTDLLAACYTEGKTIQQATLELVNSLFGAYGLVVLVPDNAKLKTAYQPVVAKELTQRFSHEKVAATSQQLGAHYKVQAGGREINLFYLINDKRERIEKTESGFEVKALGLQFSETEILNELEQYPERFSANVILRGGFQETVLPNIAFIGGGGELAYWLELKGVFEEAGIPYPVLLLRNSFLLMDKVQATKLETLGFSREEFFKDGFTLLNILVKRETEHQLSLAKELVTARGFYEQLHTTAISVDQSLSEHIRSIEKRAIKKIEELEKKLLRAERQKYEAQQRQINKLKAELFPQGSLQERVDNFSIYYAKHGKSWIEMLYKASEGITPGFGIITTE